MDAGPAKVRRRQTANVIPVKIGFVLTGTQLATFDTFYNSTIKGGAEAYEWRHPRTLNTMNFRIVGDPVYRPLEPLRDNAGKWRLNFDAEILPGIVAVPVDPPGEGGTPLVPMSIVGGGEELGAPEGGFGEPEAFTFIIGDGPPAEPAVDVFLFDPVGGIGEEGGMFDGGVPGSLVLVGDDGGGGAIPGGKYFGDTLPGGGDASS